jgi:hypothetical protein
VKKIQLTLLTYGMWAVYIAVSVYFLMLSRNSVDIYLRMFFPKGFTSDKQADLIRQAYFFFAALVLFILMIVVEEYFKNGAKKGLLGQRLARVFGLSIFLIFLVNLAYAAMLGFSPLVSISLVAELAVSAVLVWLGYKKSPAAAPKLS